MYSYWVTNKKQKKCFQNSKQKDCKETLHILFHFNNNLCCVCIICRLMCVSWPAAFYVILSLSFLSLLFLSRLECLTFHLYDFQFDWDFIFHFCFHLLMKLLTSIFGCFCFCFRFLVLFFVFCPFVNTIMTLTSL